MKTWASGTDIRSMIYLHPTPGVRTWPYRWMKHTGGRDELVWKANRAGRFSVKTAYQVALRLIQQNGAEHSDARMDGKVWKEIWALNVPPKVRNFIWRACSNILPTMENLQNRRVKVDLRCDIVVNSLKQTLTCYGNVLWHETCGQYRQEGCRNVATKCKNFFIYFERRRTS